MKSVIPFSKELDFSTKLSEITSISLEREFELKDLSIEGNLFVSGEYKSHEVSANVLPFSFKIPFSIEIPENMEEESISLEISDFAYDTISDHQIRVNIELELEGNILEQIEEQEEEEEIKEVDSEEILKFMEESSREEQEETEKTEEQEEPPLEEKIEETKMNENPKEEIKEQLNEEEPKPMKEESLRDEVSQVEIDKTKTTLKEESEEMILENITGDEEYSTYHIHIIKDGETVETVCTMYDSKLNLLTDYNDVTNLTIGDKLIIPENDES